MAERKYPIGIQTFSEVIRGRYVYDDKTDLVWQLAHYAKEMRSYMAGIPYVEGFKQKLKEAATAEGFYEYTMYLIFSMLNVYARTQVRCAGGRTDMVVWMPDAIYVFELKVMGTAQEALDQINDKGYAIPYKTDGRKIVKIGVKFKAETRTPENWIIEQFEPLIIVKCLGKVLSVSKKCVPLRNEC